jgi:hypothetical protein
LFAFSLPLVLAFGAGDGELLVVDLGVVSGADGDEVVEVGGSAVFPVVDVVDVAPVEGSVALGVGALVVVAGCQRESLGGGGEAGACAHVEYGVVGVQDCGDDPGFAGEFTDRVC